MDEISGTFYKMSRHRSGNMVLCCVEIEGIPDVEFLYRKLYSIVEMYPTLKYIPAEKKGYLKSTYYWQKREFHLQKHFIFLEKKRYDKRSFRRWINSLLRTTFAANTPEWLCYYTAYKNSNKSFIVWKCHHTYGDGFLVSEYLKRFADCESIIYPKRKRPHITIWKKIYSFLRTLMSLLYFIIFYKKQELPMDRVGAENDDALFYHCKTWNLDEIKSLKNYYKVTVNDLLYTILVKALQRYCKKNVSLSSLSMFNLRDYVRDENVTNISPNELGFMVLTSTIDSETPEELLKTNHEKFSHYKSSPITYVITQCLRILYGVSPALVVKILNAFGKKSSFGLSNFQTFSSCNYIQGHRVINISNMVVPYTVGSLFTIVSYDNKITLNVTYRERNFRHPKKFIKCLETTYKEFLSPIKN